jgi:hypothetical protein
MTRNIDSGSATFSNEAIFLFFYCAISGLLQYSITLVLSPTILKVVRYEIFLFDYIVFAFWMASLLLVGGLVRFLISIILVRLSSRVAKAISGGIGVILWIYLSLSFYVFTRFGVPLEHRSVAQAVIVQDRASEISLDLYSIFLILGVFSVVFVLEFIALPFLLNVKKIKKIFLNMATLKNSGRLIFYSGLIIGFTLIFEEADHDSVPYQALPLHDFAPGVGKPFPRLMPQYNIEKSAAFQMEKKPDIIMVLAESFRADNISPDLTPNLFRLKMSDRCIASERHYAGGHLTQYGAFSFLYGLDSYYYPIFSTARIKSAALEILRLNGYHLLGFDNSGLWLVYPPLVIPEQFNKYTKLIDEKGVMSQHSINHGRAQNDHQGVELIKKELLLASKSQPLYIFDFLYSTHSPYFFPEEVSHRTCLREQAEKNDHKRKLLNAYHNSVIYVDQLVGEIFEAGKLRNGEGNFIFVFAGDHGEEFWEFGGEGHVADRFQNVRTQVPLIMCLPKDTDRSVSFSFNKDVFPTIFDWAKAADEERIKNLFDGKSLLRQKPAQDSTLISGAGFPSEGRSLALFSEQRKYELHMPSFDPLSLELVQVMDNEDKVLEVTPSEQLEFNRVLTDHRNRFGAFLKKNSWQQFMQIPYEKASEVVH